MLVAKHLGTHKVHLTHNIHIKDMEDAMYS